MTDEAFSQQVQDVVPIFPVSILFDTQLQITYDPLIKKRVLINSEFLSIQ